MKPVPKLVLPGHSKEKVRKETPTYFLILDNLETLLAAIVDKACGNTSGSTVERFIKTRASIMFGHPVYSLDGPGTPMEVSVPH